MPGCPHPPPGLVSPNPSGMLLLYFPSFPGPGGSPCCDRPRESSCTQELTFLHSGSHAEVGQPRWFDVEGAVEDPTGMQSWLMPLGRGYFLPRWL